MSIPDNVVDKNLYKRVKKEASKKFDAPTSAYRSMWIVSRYKQLGGTYRGSKTKSKGTSKWLRENWVQVEPYLKSGKKIQCGRNKNTKACRPLNRVDNSTPITINELKKIHNTEKLISLCKKKQKDMNGRLNWKKGTFTPSK